MPLKKCDENGWKWGDNGKCYSGPDAKKKAIKQGLVIEGPEKFSEKAVEQDLEFSDTELDFIADWMAYTGHSVVSIASVFSTLSKRTMYIYEDPKTGEQFTYRKMGNYRKDGRVLMYVGTE